MKQHFSLEGFQRLGTHLSCYILFIKTGFTVPFGDFSAQMESAFVFIFNRPVQKENLSLFHIQFVIYALVICPNLEAVALNLLVERVIC